MTINKVSKSLYIIQTVELLKKEFPDNPEILSSFNSIMDSVSHTAPEVISQRWNKIYNLCITYCTDSSNTAHMNAYKIYHNRIKEYYDLYLY